MKTRNIILFFIGLIAFCSCDDMFEPADENTRQEDAMINEYEYANGLLMYGYGSLPYLNSTETDIATDDAVTNETSSALLKMATGSWSSLESPTPINRWDACLAGVQYVNKFLTLVNQVEWTPSSESKKIMFRDRLRGEAYALRAIFYYHLLQSHGGETEDGELLGVPLFTQPLDASSDFNMKRATFKECVDQIYMDCDSAMYLLPLDYKNAESVSDIPEKYIKIKAELSGYNTIFGQNLRNRISARIAEVVKAQTALLASSPAFKGSGVSSADAAELIANVLNKNNGLEGLDPTGNLDWYSSTYKNLIDATVPEVIWRSDRQQNNTQEKAQFPPSLYGNGRVNPSQNLVDAFPMNNGLPITDPNSGYDPQNPYKNRDMRLKNTIIYNGVEFHKNVIYTGVDMAYGKNNDEFADNLQNMNKSTRTGYYLKKLLREDVSANPSSPAEQKHIYVRMRYTELYLAYAEAANDAWGPTGKAPNCKFSAYEVIKKIRERAGIGKDEYGRDLPGGGGDQYIDQCDTKEKMAELIRNERRLELCFENKRFWDLRRWKMPLNESIKGMKITRSNPKDTDSPLVYEVINVEDRLFSDYQCYGPIPNAEILKWSNLKQNKGW